MLDENDPGLLDQLTGGCGAGAIVSDSLYTVSAETVTPHAEAFQAVVWHLIVSHPGLKASEMKWESTR